MCSNNTYYLQEQEKTEGKKQGGSCYWKQVSKDVFWMFQRFCFWISFENK